MSILERDTYHIFNRNLIWVWWSNWYYTLYFSLLPLQDSLHDTKWYGEGMQNIVCSPVLSKQQHDPSKMIRPRMNGVLSYQNA